MHTPFYRYLRLKIKGQRSIPSLSDPLAPALPDADRPTAVGAGGGRRGHRTRDAERQDEGGGRMFDL